MVDPLLKTVWGVPKEIKINIISILSIMDKETFGIYLQWILLSRNKGDPAFVTNWIRLGDSTLKKISQKQIIFKIFRIK